MIALEQVRARAVPRGARSGATLVDLSAQLDAGVWALVDVEPGAARLLLDLLGGHARPSRGRVRVLGEDPGSIGARVAYVPRDAALPAGLTVREVARLEADLRGRDGADARARLEALDLAELADRPTRSLGRHEARGVALALALTSGAALVLAEEPYLDLDERAAPRLGGAVRALGPDVAVVVSTASRREAALLGARALTLDGARLAPAAARHEGPGVVEVVVAEPRRLVAALGDAPAITRVEADERGVVRLHATDRLEAARAVMRAAVDGDVALLRLESRAEEDAR